MCLCVISQGYQAKEQRCGTARDQGHTQELTRIPSEQTLKTESPRDLHFYIQPSRKKKETTTESKTAEENTGD